MFELAKGLVTDSEEVEEGRCMQISDGKLCFNEVRGTFCKDYFEMVMNEEDDWDHNV